MALLSNHLISQGNNLLKDLPSRESVKDLGYKLTTLNGLKRLLIPAQITLSCPSLKMMQELF